jgi:hypothetical protein
MPGVARVAPQLAHVRAVGGARRYNPEVEKPATAMPGRQY